MSDTNDTQALHNSFVEPLQVETSNNTTNPHCAKLSPEEISIDSQEPNKNDYVFAHVIDKRNIEILKQQLDNIDIEKYQGCIIGIVTSNKPGIENLIHDILFS